MKKFFVNIIKTAAAAAAVTAAVLLTGMSASAESGFLAGYDSVVFNTENGLDSASVNSAVQTPDGYIWLGTYTGLYRYDGSRFTLMSEEDGISSVRSLFTDSRGGMWVGTNDSGAAYYGSDGGEPIFFSKADGLPSNSVRCFCETPDGTVYIGTSGALCTVSPSGEISKVTEDEDITYVISLAVSESGIVAGVTNSGVLFAIDGEKIYKAAITPGNGLSFSCVCFEKGRKFLAGSSGSYIYSCIVDNDGISFGSKAYAGGISGICSIKPDGSGGWWFCGDAGLAHADEKFSSEIIRCEDFSGRVDDVITDYQGNYWFVSARQGLMKLSKNPFTDINAEYGFPPETANAAEIYGGSIYFGFDNGLKIIDDATGREVENELTRRLDGTRIRHVYADSKGYIWISTYGTEGLFRYKPENGETAVYSESSGGTLGSKFRFVTELSDGSILASSTTGLSYIREGKVICTLGTDHGLEMPQILCAAELEDGTVLAGSDGDGIYVIKGGRIYKNIGEDDGLTSLVVMRIVKYKDVFFIVTGNSLFLMDKEGNVSKLTGFRYTNNFDVIADEESGRVLILSSAGIFEVNGDDLAANRCESCVLYNKRSGLNTSITANSWSKPDGKGGLYLCCSTGIRYVLLSELSEPRMDYKLSVNNVSLSDGTVILPENVGGYDGRFVIPAEANRVSFQPVVLNYTLNDPELYIFLEGFEEKGMYVNQSGLDEVSFTNIPYGSYYFHLQVIDPNSGEPALEKVYLVEKEAQFFEQPVFKIYLAIVAIGAAVFITWVITKIGNIGVIKRQYEEIRAAKEEADKANNAKSRFLANVSHEIRTPINTILGMDEMILRECADPQIVRYASDIKHSGTMLLAIVSDILDVSKIESGQMKLIPADYDISVVISDLAGMAEIKCREKGLEFRCEVSPDTPRFLYGDDLRIKQVISNLLSNAVKYTEKGHVTLKIRCEDEGGENVLLCVSVEDSGIGIKEEEQDKLFAEFERLDEKRNRSIEGTGLGLSISRNLLEMMDSKLEFISEYGSGSVFGFSVKQKRISAETVGKLSFRPGGSSLGKNKGAHLFSAPDAEILVVDDNKMNIEVVKSLLKGTKIKIDAASGGAKCLEAAAKKRYSMILLDHMMPEMDGIETLEKIRCGEGLCRDVPVIILTANAVAGSRQMYLDKGFDDYLTKPVSGAELERMILRYLPEELIKPPCEPDLQSKKPTAAAEQLKHIDIKTGLLYADGSAELLERIMTIYIEQSGKTAEMAENCFAAGDMKNYEIVIHSLKSTSLGIGAKELSEAAKKLENAARNGDTEYVKAHHGEAMSLYRLVIAEVEEYLDSNG